MTTIVLLLADLWFMVFRLVCTVSVNKSNKGGPATDVDSWLNKSLVVNTRKSKMMRLETAGFFKELSKKDLR